MAEDEQSDGFEELIEQSKQAFADFDWSATPTEDEEASMSVLSFGIGEHRFAVTGEDVREIIRSPEITPIPGTPRHIMGIIVHRRQVVGVLDLLGWLQMNAYQEHDALRLVIVEHGDFIVALPTDQTTRIEEWSREQLSGVLPQTLPSRVRTYTKATREHAAGRATILLDIKSILDDAAVRRVEAES
ncbi:MAG: chemotaxis protein CheW [Myxococcota bacterium]